MNARSTAADPSRATARPTNRTTLPELRTRRPWMGALGVAIAVALTGLPVEAPEAAIRNPEDVMIVDCLLPGQVRKLGRVSTYMSARRPVRTSQADCEIRGGEFVSFDRADYRTALEVWMTQAQTGDAEAQNYVGEIYSKGLGREPDYSKAAEWFQKAVDQGNKRSMINLGYLYEQGLGVEKDVPKALNLYRQASGGSNDDLVFASTVTISEETQAELETLRSTVASQQSETEQLRGRVQELEQQLNERKRALQQSRSELESARSEVIAKQTALDPQGSAELDAMRKQYEADEQGLAAERAKLEKERAEFAAKVTADRARLAELRTREEELARQSDGRSPDSKSTEELARIRSAATELALALDTSESKFDQMQAQLAANEAKLGEQQQKFDAERKKMQAQLAASQQDRELLLLLEKKLSEKQREVSRQRQQIASLEQQVTGGVPASGRSAAASGGVATTAGLVLEILEPAITGTRGRNAATVRSQSGSTEIMGRVISGAGVSAVQVNGKAVAVGAGGVFRTQVPVAAAGSVVQIAALDRAGKKANQSFTLLPAPPGSVGAAPSAPSAGGIPKGVTLGRYHALVIGNDAYSGYPKLTSAVSDSKMVGNVLQTRYGFKTRVLNNANRFEILSALNDVRESLGPNDNLLVYFAGHGELDAGTQQGYWIPIDGQEDTPKTWISNRAITDILNTMQARHVMVVADSCYSGAMTRASVPRSTQAMAPAQWAQWLKTASASRSRTALTSGGLAPVPDSSSGGNSLFAQAFVNTLEDNNRLLEGASLFRSVTRTVAVGASEATLAQQPEYAPIRFAGHEAGEFFFMPSGRTAAAGMP